MNFSVATGRLHVRYLHIKLMGIKYADCSELMPHQARWCTVRGLAVSLVCDAVYLFAV